MGKLKAYVLSSAEQDGHDQRMGESDLEAVYQAVPCALEDGEVVMVSRVVQDGLECDRCRHLDLGSTKKVLGLGCLRRARSLRSNYC
jgi:hypothetical protein